MGLRMDGTLVFFAVLTAVVVAGLWKFKLLKKL
jgi:hypothetical protein